MRQLKGGLASPGPNATGLQVSTNNYGDAIPLTYGFDRINPKPIWTSNFLQHSGGGSGLGSGGGGGETYTCNVDMLLGFNPMEGITDLWYNGTWYYTFSFTYVVNVSSVGAGGTVNFTVPPGGITGGNPLIMISGVYLSGIPYSESYNDYVFPGETSSIVLSGDGILPLYNNAFAAPNNGAWSTLGIPYASYNSPYGSSSGSVHFPYAISTPFSICVVYFGRVNDGGTAPLIGVQLVWESELGNGSSGQPNVYPEFAGVSGENILLGGSPSLPQWSLRTKGMFGIGYPLSVGTQLGNVLSDNLPIVQTACCGDCNPADVVFDIVSSGNNVAAFGTGACWNHGAGFSAVVYDPSGGQDNQYQYSRYGSLAIDEDGTIAFLKMRNYSLAYSIFVSGSLTSQTGCAQVLKDLAEVTNCAPCFNGAALDFIPYCEVSNFANGASFVAPTATGPVFNFTTRDFLTNKKDTEGQSSPKPPVVHPGGAPDDDNFNSLAVSIKDRTGTTNNNTIIITDAADVSRQGPMAQGSRSWSWVQDPGIATNAAWAVLRRAIIVKRDGTYSWSLPGKWSPFVSLMDLCTLSEPSLGPDIVTVRITKIEEDETDMSLQLEAEKFVYGASIPLPPGVGVTGVVAGGGGGGSGTGQDPGSVNTPVFMETVPALTTAPELWIGVSGGTPISNGIAGCTKVSGGANYVTATATVVGSGTGALLQPVVSAGQVTSILVVDPGQNYTGTVTINIVDPTGAGSGASYTAVVQASMAVSYGGCLVYMSTDGGTTYDPVESLSNVSMIPGSQTMGLVYSSNYPSHVDPDTSDTLNVDLTESQSTLSAFTTAQQNSFLSLCYLQGGGTITGANGQTLTIPYELIAYSAASLSGTNKYALGPPIRRGVYGTPVAAHNIGSQFSFVLDGNIFKLALPASLIGVTLYFKFLAYNRTNSFTQDLSAATAYSFTPSGQVGFSQQSYAITPYPALYQGQSGGWPGVDGSSTGWTNVNNVYFPATTATFSSGKVLNYAARDSGLAAFTGGGQQVWVTIYDPNQVGESNGVASLNAYADTNQTRWNTPGYTRIGTITSVSGGGGSGGGGGSSGTSALYSIAPFQGDPTITAAAGQPAANQLLLAHLLPGPTAITNVTLPAGLTGSIAQCKVAPTGSVTITINRISGGTTTAIGSINFAASSKVGTFTFASAVALNPNDELDFVFQATTDATFAGVYWNIVGTRS